MTALSITIGAAIIVGLVGTAALLALTHTRTRTVVDHAPVDEPTGPSEEERARHARRELRTAVRYIQSGLGDVHDYLDTASAEEARVRLVAAHHQLTDAMHALGRARAALPSPAQTGGDRG